MTVKMEHCSKTSNENNSDYGSDFSNEEEQILAGLLQCADETGNAGISSTTIQHGARLWESTLPHREKPSNAVPGQEEPTSQIQDRRPSPPHNYDGKFAARLSATNQPQLPRESPWLAHGHSKSGLEHDPVDTRSPLERFRTRPQKPLSVTDLISPSWCELQYWYTLAKHGKKRPTPAMKRGSRMHKTLEDQVHKTVEISVSSREEAFALRILNVAQGLRSLRESGMTRELEVWGVIDGQVVNGIIDELSYICPDRDLEVLGSNSVMGTLLRVEETAAVASHATSEIDQNNHLRSLDSMQEWSSKIYLSDVKTRGHKSIPKGASFRPTLYQLMLYHVLLSALVEDRVDFEVIATRYDLDSQKGFSDEFFAQVSSLDHSYHDGESNTKGSRRVTYSSQDPLDIVLSHNSLSHLWAFMVEQLHLTMPNGKESIGSVLKAEYRDRNDNSILGMKTFLHDEEVLASYIKDEMMWWRGERDPHGVCIEEAFKCRSCDFQEGCEWRLSKLEEATKTHRSRIRSEV